MEDPLLDMDELEREKTYVLEELLNVQSNDITKVEVSDLILRYFESYKFQNNAAGVINYEDPWSINNQAVRQLFSASRRVPRTRYFPGSKVSVPRPGSVNYDQYHQQLRDQRSARLTKLQELRSREATMAMADGAQDAGAVPAAAAQNANQQQLASLAEHMVEQGLTYQDIEHEVSAVAERLTDEALTYAELNIELHNLATCLVKTCLEKATDHLRDMGYVVSRETSAVPITDVSMSRIDAIATQLVEQATETATSVVAAELEQQETQIEQAKPVKQAPTVHTTKEEQLQPAEDADTEEISQHQLSFQEPQEA